jgi:alpha-mannosidase
MHEARTSINPKSEIRNKFKFMEIKKRKEKRRQKDEMQKVDRKHHPFDLRTPIIFSRLKGCDCLNDVMSKCFRCFSILTLPTLVGLCVAGPPQATAATFTRLEKLPSPKVVASAEAYPGGQFKPENLVDDATQTEYSSNAKGTNTFVEVDFGAPVSIAAFRHVDRRDRATVATSELIFLDAAGQILSTVPVTHVNRSGGVTTLIFSTPVIAHRVRWHITGLGSPFSTVGGAGIAFFTSSEAESAPERITIRARQVQLLEGKGNGLVQPLKVTVDYPYAEDTRAKLLVPGADQKPLNLKFGSQTVEVAVPAVTSEKSLEIVLLAGPAETRIKESLTVKPVRRWEIYLLPHSHVDIGYTALQADVEKKQDSNLETGLRLARATANYAEGARFKWNTEVLWPVDNYLRTATAEQRAAFISAVKSGQIGLDAFYGNTLTGLCRPEELINLMGYATRLSEICGVPIESAMISDVPGYTWSTVTAMAQAGVKYFSFAPNYFDRMGGTMKEWQNRPFWWKGPDGKSRVLCWCPSRGYALGHLIGDGEALARFIPDYLVELETNSYPYDITYLRWNVHGDNGSPDEKLSDVVRDWNQRYVSPRLIISTTAAAFRQFERRYGSKLPEFSGDYTPYWEDGAASSALETALNRASAERLVQAETLWAILHPSLFPAEAFHAAWRNVLLYSEHTWGAHNSISEPDAPFVRDQWKVKQAFALDADRQSRELLAGALEPVRGAEARAGEIEVFNTSSWTRSDLVTLTPDLSQPGDRVLDHKGRAVPSQRISSGELAFLARDVPPFSAERFQVIAGSCPTTGTLKIEPERGTLSSSEFVVRIDEQKGGIKSLFSRSLNQELVDPKSATSINDYFYLPGSDLKKLERNGTPRITEKERGPLVASLLVECDAPSCKKLLREVRLIAELDRVEIINTVDKLPVRKKEGIHFGYGFDVPGGMPRFDVGLAAVRPELDQIPAACKNWFSVQRWVDISNDKYGVTWAPVDAPLVELGGITANLVGSQTDYRVWIQHLKPSSTIYSWAMNNHWHTNYRADQEGPTVFRFAIRVHRGFKPEEAARFGMECSQPLIVTRASTEKPTKPRLQLSSDTVVVSALKPSDDGKGYVVRLFGASGKTQKVTLAWSEPAPGRVWLSDTSEKRRQAVGNSIEVPGWGLVTLRTD